MFEDVNEAIPKKTIIFSGIVDFERLQEEETYDQKL